MKFTKTFALAALIAGGLFAGSTLQAQDATTNSVTAENSGSAHMHGRHNIAKELNLTADQKPKFKAIMHSAMEKMKAVRKDSSLSKADKRAKGKAIREDISTQMKALLTTDQFTQWQTAMKNMHHKRHGAGGR